MGIDRCLFHGIRIEDLVNPGWMKRESLYLHETEVIRNGRKQSSFAWDGGPSSPRRIFDRTGVAHETRALLGGRRRAGEGGDRADKIGEIRRRCSFVIDSLE
jgi:hypothetical protein